MRKILIIEDDQTLRRQIKEILESYAYSVVEVTDFRRIEECFMNEAPDLVILDINLPYYDGNYYCRMFRKRSNIPIIIISARNGDMDQILSMELGADEYVIKPFHIQVLLAKVNALVRRLYGEYAVSNSKENHWNEVQGLVLDDKSFKLSYQEHTVELSKTEYRLMKAFLTQPNTVLTREELLEALWDMTDFIDDNTLTVNVTRLRGKLKEITYPEVIKTKRGVGYLFDISEVEGI